MHDQTAYKNLKVPVGSCPVAEQLCHTVLSLPIHPYISEEDIDSVCEGILTFIAKK